MGGILDICDIEDVGELTTDMLNALTAPRGAPGQLTIDKFAQSPVLVRVSGGGDPLDGYFAFRRELQRCNKGDRQSAAAVLSLLAEAETVLDRLQKAAQQLPRTMTSATNAPPGDGATVDCRHWLIGTVEHCTEMQPSVIIDELTDVGLLATAPPVRCWHGTDGESTKRQGKVDLEQVSPSTAEDGGHRLSRDRVQVEIPTAGKPGPVLGLSVEGRNSPMVEGRNSPMNECAEGSTRPAAQAHVFDFTRYRTIAAVTVDAVATGRMTADRPRIWGCQAPSKPGRTDDLRMPHRSSKVSLFGTPPGG
ncbi:MAG: hypothetical protein ACK5MT_17770 [Actinomycetales bacterium]